MGQRKIRLVNDIVSGKPSGYLKTWYGLTDSTLDRFKRFNSSEITLRILKDARIRS